MAIRDKNIEDNNSYNQFAQKIVPINFGVVNASVALASSSIGKVKMPWAGKIISAEIDYSTSSGSVDIALSKNGTAISNVTTSGTNALTLTASTFASGDTLELLVTTASNEYAYGTCTVILRPYLGVLERVSASLGDS
jgi:hypothetical protein